MNRKIQLALAACLVAGGFISETVSAAPLNGLAPAMLTQPTEASVQKLWYRQGPGIVIWHPHCWYFHHCYWPRPYLRSNPWH